MTPAKMLTAKTAGERLSMTQEHIRNLCRRGELDHHLINGRYRISEEQLARFLLRCRVHAQTESLRSSASPAETNGTSNGAKTGPSAASVQAHQIRTRRSASSLSGKKRAPDQPAVGR